MKITNREFVRAVDTYTVDIDDAVVSITSTVFDVHPEVRKEFEERGIRCSLSSALVSSSDEDGHLEYSRTNFLEIRSSNTCDNCGETEESEYLHDGDTIFFFGWGKYMIERN